MNNHQEILFSVITPTFNRAHLISKTIQSVIDQTYANWELIVVDDGSTDNTEEVINAFNDNRIKYYYKKNEERSVARNFGIDKANGEYISFLDDDDYYLPDFFTEFYSKILLENKPVAAFICNEYQEDKNGERTLINITKQQIEQPIKMIWEIQSSVRSYVFHREILQDERFNTKCYFIEDFILALKVTLKYKLFHIPLPLNVYYQHDNRGTKTKLKKNYKENALIELGCLENILETYNVQILKVIDRPVVYSRLNHKIYAYASTSMKNCNFAFMTKLIFRFSLKANLSKVLYYYISLISRVPYYFWKCLTKKNNL